MAKNSKANSNSPVATSPEVENDRSVEQNGQTFLPARISYNVWGEFFDDLNQKGQLTLSRQETLIAVANFVKAKEELVKQKRIETQVEGTKIGNAAITALMSAGLTKEQAIAALEANGAFAGSTARKTSSTPSSNVIFGNSTYGSYAKMFSLVILVHARRKFGKSEFNGKQKTALVNANAAILHQAALNGELTNDSDFTAKIIGLHANETTKNQGVPFVSNALKTAMGNVYADRLVAWATDEVTNVTGFDKLPAPHIPDDLLNN